jgi:hypothetical protein
LDRALARCSLALVWPPVGGLGSGRRASLDRFGQFVGDRRQIIYHPAQREADPWLGASKSI